MRLVGWLIVAAIATGTVRPAAAQSGPLAPAGGPPPRESREPILGEPPPEPVAAPRQTTQSSRPPNVLGPPVRGVPVRPIDREPLPVSSGTVASPSETVTPIGSYDSTPAPVRRAALGAPESAGTPISSQSLESSSHPSPVSSDKSDPVTDLLVNRSTEKSKSQANATSTKSRTAATSASTANFGEQVIDTVDGAMVNVMGDRHDWFRSDHAFDNFISPVSSPFLFEDPRSLSEVRPIFMYQKIPGNNSTFQGGDTWFFGLQARVAITERLSFTMNKLGGLSVSTGNDSLYDGGTGFAELWLGPKYTIIRNEQTGTLLAGGLQFQIPIGSSSVFQDTGSLSLVPYITFGQNFGRDLSWGSFNTLLATGYAISTDSQRSDYYWLSAHFDWDVFNNHRFYPLVEFNWMYYTTNGEARPVPTEGRDLFNLGGQASQTGMVTVAFGGRFKLTESAQIGGAFEIPIAGPRQMFDYRVTVDFILRY